MASKTEFDTDDERKNIEKKDGPVYWRNWYIAVTLFLVAQVILYYVITQHFK